MNVSTEQIQVAAEKISRQVVLLRRRNDQQGNDSNKLPCSFLLSVEAQQISNTLQSFITDIELAVSRFAFLHADDALKMDDEEMKKSLQEHQMLVQRLDLERAQREVSKETRAQLEKDLMKSVRTLFKHFRANPGDIFDLKRTEGSHVLGRGEVLTGALKSFHRHTVERLKTNPDEGLHQLLHVPQPSSTAQKLRDVIKLEEEMSALIKTVDLKAEETNEEINILESQLQEDDTKELPVISDDHCQSHIKSSDVRRAATQKETEELVVQLKSLILKNKDEERELQEKNERIELEIEEFLHDFDEKIEENQAKLEKVQTLLRHEEGEIERLEKPYAVLEKEYDLVMERRRQSERRRQEELKELKLKSKAAVVIQAHWRGLSTRNTLKRKSKVKKSKTKKKERKTRVLHKQR